MWLEKQEWWKTNPLVYVDECIRGIHFLLLHESVPLDVRVNSIFHRLKQIPRVIEEAKRNIQNPPKLFCEIALDKLDQGINFFKQSIPPLAEHFPENMTEDFLTANQNAIKAMEDYKEVLQDMMFYGTDDFAIGKELYNFKLKTEHLLDMDADSLLKIGEYYLNKSRKQIDSLETLRRAAELETQEIFTAPEDFSADDVLKYYRDEIDSVRNFVARKAIVTVPSDIGEFKVVEMPEFLRPIIPGIAMEPPPSFDSVQTGFFYIQPLSEEFTRDERARYYNYVKNRDFRGAVVHEGYPGHFLQLSIANRHPSNIRKAQEDMFPIEGWALYCEEFMTRSGLYESEWAIIDALWGILFRAVRVIVDVKLQTGQFTYEEAVNFMIDQVGVSGARATGEVKRYCTDPTQAPSYLIGKHQILELIDDYKKLKGPDFDLREFHDKLLAEGSIPVKLIRIKLLGE